MRKLLWLGFLLLPLCGRAQEPEPENATGLRALDERNGFRTYHFGEARAAFPQMELAEADGDQRFYRLKNDYLKIGEAELIEIVYEFYKDRFGYVVFTCKGYANQSIVKKALEVLYGQGVQRKATQQSYRWDGKRVMMGFDEDSTTQVTKFWLRSLVISGEEDAAASKAAKKAAGDL